MHRRLLTFCAAIICLALAGCGRSPRVSFYTLGTAEKTAAADQTGSAPAVLVANITLPDLADRPQLVERVTANRVEILETHRWAEPLKIAISRVLAENLASRLGSNRVTAYPQSADSGTDYTVTVDIRRFESMGDTVSVDAVWNVRRTSDGGSRNGSSQIREVRSGEGYEGLVAAYNRAIASLGGDIAREISATEAAAR